MPEWTQAVLALAVMTFTAWLMSPGSRWPPWRRRPWPQKRPPIHEDRQP